MLVIKAGIIITILQTRNPSVRRLKNFSTRTWTQNHGPEAPGELITGLHPLPGGPSEDAGDWPTPTSPSHTSCTELWDMAAQRISGVFPVWQCPCEQTAPCWLNHPPPGGRRAPATIKGAISPAMHVRWPALLAYVQFTPTEWCLGSESESMLYLFNVCDTSLWSRKIIEVKTRKVCMDPKTCLSNPEGQGPGEINPPNFS